METKQIPQYQCHKTVSAFKIAEIKHHVGQPLEVTLIPEDEGIKPVVVGQKYMDRHQPEVGGYFVIYEDGYVSYSPGAVFEAGYSLVYGQGVWESPKPAAQTDIDLGYDMLDDTSDPSTLFDPSLFTAPIAPPFDPVEVGLAKTIEYVARECHEANRRYCGSVGDYSQHEWSDAPDWQRESAKNGVKFHFENPNASASASHENWLKEKEADGWKYGPVKDPEKKEHPCFVPYGELPQEQQNKDTLFITVVHNYMHDLYKAHAGF